MGELLTAKGLDGVQLRGARGWVQSEEQSDQCGDADAQGDRPHLDAGGNGREGRDGRRDARAEHRADDAAEQGQDDGLGEHLRHDVMRHGVRADELKPGTGLGLGIIEGFTKVFYPELSSTVVFIIMAIVLLIRPAGLFGHEK